jgi:hypothetical protein
MKGPVTIVVAVTFAVSLPARALANKRHELRQHHLGAEFYTRAPIQCAPQPACESPDAVFSAGTYVGSDPGPPLRAQLASDFNRGVNSLHGR